MQWFVERKTILQHNGVEIKDYPTIQRVEKGLLWMERPFGVRISLNGNLPRSMLRTEMAGY